jgi:uncharacterized membrane protein
MILTVLNNAKSHLLLSALSLIIALSVVSTTSLLASRDDISMQEDTKSLKRPRDVNDNEGRPLSLKRPRTDPETDPVFIAANKHLDDVAKDLWNFAPLFPMFFPTLSYKEIRAARCVSKSWRQILSSDDFCNAWGVHFAPSTPDAMKLTPQQFIHYWSTPSFTILSDDRFSNYSFNSMSADSSIIVGEAKDGINNNRLTAVRWVNGEIVPLPTLNGWYSTTVNGMSADSSIITGYAYDGNNRKTAVRWVNGEIMPLPMLNGWSNVIVNNVSADGSIIVGHFFDRANLSLAVRWVNGKIMPLPMLNGGASATAEGMNGNGSIITGHAYDGANNSRRTPVQWINGTITPLPFLNNGGFARARWVNGDGSIIVGEAKDGTNHRITAARWINGEIMPLPTLNGGVSAIVKRMNGDGSIIVGESLDGSNNKRTPVQWINGTITPLPFLNNGQQAAGYRINGDGSIIVGEAQDGANNNGYISVQWINGKIFSIQERLKAAGLDIDEAINNSTMKRDYGICLIEECFDKATPFSSGYHDEEVNLYGEMESDNGLQLVGKCFKKETPIGPEYRVSFKAILPSKYTRSDFDSVMTDPLCKGTLTHQRHPMTDTRLWTRIKNAILNIQNFLLCCSG